VVEAGWRRLLRRSLDRVPVVPRHGR